MKKFFASGTGFILITVVLYVLIWGGMIFAMRVTNTGQVTQYSESTKSASTYIWIIFGLPCMIFGWRTLSSMQIGEGWGCFMPLLWWLIFYFIKAIIAFIIGVFVTPFKLAQMIHNRLQSPFSQ